MSNFLGLQIISDEQLAKIKGRPSVLYKLDHPPHRWYRWNGISFVQVGANFGNGPPILPPSPIPGALSLDGLALALDGLALGFEFGIEGFYLVTEDGSFLITEDGSFLVWD